MATYTRTITETVGLGEHINIDGFAPTITETVGFGEILIGKWPKTISEDVEFNEVLTPKTIFKPTITETPEFSDSVTAQMTFKVSITETPEFSDSVSASQLMRAIITEQLLVQGTIYVKHTAVGGANDAEVWTAWVVNTRNFAVSEYDRYNFHSFTEFDGKYYGANANGVFELEGDWDDGWLIKALVKTGILDFDNEFQKKMPRMYLGLRNDDTMVLKTITNEDTVRWYNLKENQTGMGKSRILAHGSPKSAYWQFELANTTGDDFDLNSIELMPIVTSRRIK